MPALTRSQFPDIIAAVGDASLEEAASFRAFVETGTGLGQTIINMAEQFNELHTIEIKQEFFEASCLVAPRAKAPIHFYHGPSEKVLPEILMRLKGPTVFFLDAHWSGQDTGRGDVHVPLLLELRALNTLFHHRALVILDDFRLFAPGEGREVCEVDWSPISVEAVHSVLRPERITHAVVVGDRYVVVLRKVPLAGSASASLSARYLDGGTGVRDSGRQVLDRNCPSCRWCEPFLSTPGSRLDAEGLAALAARGEVVF